MSSDQPWQRLSRAQQEARIRAVRVVAAQRRNPSLSLQAAARREGIAARTVLTYFGRWYRRDGRGPARPLPKDAEPFLMNVYSTQGVVEVVAADSDERSLGGSHSAAVWRFRDSGRTDQLNNFRGRQLGGVTLETDPVRLLPLLWRGPEFLDIYSV